VARILVADDNSALANVVRFHLQRAGHDVVVVNNGQDALETILESSFEVLITDEQMPELTGIELSSILREQHPELGIAIVLLTAKRFELNVADVKEQHGISEIFPKPFSPSELVSFVQGLLVAVEE